MDGPGREVTEAVGRAGGIRFPSAQAGTRKQTNHKPQNHLHLAFFQFTPIGVSKQRLAMQEKACGESPAPIMGMPTAILTGPIQILE